MATAIMSKESASNGVLGPLSRSDAFALESLYKAQVRPLVRYIQSRFGSGPPDPEDVAQQTFARLANSRKNLSEIESPERYLHTIACNIVLDHHRLVENREARSQDIALEDTESLSDFSPDHVLEAKERLRIFEKALDAMPPARRKIFILVRVEGMDPRAVARYLLMSEMAVRKQVVRAVADCMAAFEDADRRGARLR